MNHAQTAGEKKKKSKEIEAMGDATGADAAVEGLRERVEQARDIVETVREKAEVAFRDKPYLVPVAAGAVGFGVGLLFGSRITRFIAFAAVGTVLSDVLGGEVKRIAGDFLGEFKKQLSEGEDEVPVSSAV